MNARVNSGGRQQAVGRPRHPTHYVEQLDPDARALVASLCAQRRNRIDAARANRWHQHRDTGDHTQHGGNEDEDVRIRRSDAVELGADHLCCGERRGHPTTRPPATSSPPTHYQSCDIARPRTDRHTHDLPSSFVHRSRQQSEEADRREHERSDAKRRRECRPVALVGNRSSHHRPHRVDVGHQTGCPPSSRPGEALRRVPRGPLTRERRTESRRCGIC